MLKLITSRICLSSLSRLLFAVIVINGTIIANAQSGETLLATVKNRAITREEIDRSVLAQLLPLEQQIYALRKAALENHIVRILLEEEAKRRGIAVDELKRMLTEPTVEIPVSQIEQAFLENEDAFAQMSPDEAKERIRLDLESQARMRAYRAAVSKLKEDARIEIRLKAPSLPYESLDVNAPTIGERSAPVTIVAFSDFQCPFCKESIPVIRQVIERFGTNVRFVFKHLPLSIHKQAFPAAQAAYCAGQQGSFWQYHDALFAAETVSPATIERIALQFKLDIVRFRSCLQSEDSRNAILKDSLDARKLGIDGTPAFIVNGKPFRGVLDLESFTNIIEQELKSAQTHKNQ